jgi:hypothetical protein
MNMNMHVNFSREYVNSLPFSVEGGLVWWREGGEGYVTRASTKQNIIEKPGWTQPNPTLIFQHGIRVDIVLFFGITLGNRCQIWTWKYLSLF